MRCASNSCRRGRPLRPAARRARSRAAESRSSATGSAPQNARARTATRRPPALPRLPGLVPVLEPPSACWRASGTRATSTSRPQLSPTGSTSRTSPRSDLFGIDLFLADAETGEVISKLEEVGTDPHFDALRFIASAGTWSPTATVRLRRLRRRRQRDRHPGCRTRATWSAASRSRSWAPSRTRRGARTAPRSRSPA